MKKITVVPEPVSLKVRSDSPVFTLTDGVAFEGNNVNENALSDLTSFLERTLGLMPTGMGKEKIRMEISLDKEEEGYRITVEKDRIVLTGNSEKGLFYAVQTLKQLLFQTEGKLPEMEIHDYPRFSSRGFMLDCGRYFFTVEAVKQFIDIMALHKLNEFHWHLSEDQGFRCQLEGKLLLTEIGSRRSHTNFNTIAHEGYYTKAQLKEIIDYAHKRYIKVIPEIDSPGHVMSMLAAYPELACFKRDYTVSTFWGVKHDVLCIGKESTFRFMEELYDELTDIFTDGIIHLGGDEVPTVRWKICPDCQRRMKEEGFRNESDLHAYYLNRIADYLRKKGNEVRIWDDKTGGSGIDGNICRQLWTREVDEGDTVSQLNSGVKYMLSPSGYCYLDLPYAHIGLERCYNLKVFPDTLTEEGKKNIIGVEACLWTEFVPDMLTADRLTHPRLAAISESAWSKEEKKDYELFCQKLLPFRELLFAEGITSCNIKRAEPKGISKVFGKLYWERRKLCWGAHHNILSDIRAKKLLKELKESK